MIRVALVGKIGSGKTFISELFGYPVFNADKIVSKIYAEDKKIYKKLKKQLPNFFLNFPIKKKELIKAIEENKKNIKIISSIVHPEVRKNLNIFLKKNKNKKLVVLDIPLFLENKLNKINDKIIFVDSKTSDILKRIKTRENFNKKIFERLKNLQYSINKKKKSSSFIIKNNFKKNLVKKAVKDIMVKIIPWKK